jgi:protein SCO1
VGALMPETPRWYWPLAAYSWRGNVNAIFRSGRGGCDPPYGALRVVSVMVLVVLLGFVEPAFADKSANDVRLPKIGPAPEFTLTTHQGKPLSLRDLRGNVAVVTFIFTACGDTCPILTAKLVAIQRKLAADIKSKVFFTAITVDPERDNPEVLQRYAQAHNADPAYWAFLTGSRAEIDDVTRRYSIYQKQQAKGDVDHTFLTSLIDKEGTLRVQYLGVRFNPKEFSDDLRALTRE